MHRLARPWFGVVLGGFWAVFGVGVRKRSDENAGDCVFLVGFCGVGGCSDISIPTPTPIF